MPFGSDGQIYEVSNREMDHVVVSVGTSPTILRVGASNLEERQEIFIFNDSDEIIRIGGPLVALTGSKRGIPVEPGETVTVDWGPNITLYGICASGNKEVIVFEVA